jgi:hypothetical protein
MPLTSDPHAWLRPFFARLRAHPGFSDLEPRTQFRQLCEAVSVNHPTEASQMLSWSPGAQEGLLLQLVSSAEQTPPAVTSELWRLHKGSRHVNCSAQYLVSGIDLRLFEGEGMRRTQLCRDAPEAATVAEEWRQELVNGGWEREETKGTK